MPIRPLLIASGLLLAGASHAVSAQSATTQSVVGAPYGAAAEGRLGTGAAKPLETTRRRLPGYLQPEGSPDAFAILPPPPAPGSQAQALDRTIFLQTRALQGAPRWALAAQDALETPAAFESDLSCAVGVRLDAASTPAMIRLISRLGMDAGAMVNRVKERYRRPRPFVGDASPICVARTDALTASYSYPSGHSTFGWAAGLVLAEIEPDRATQILARARAFGESRVVCGVHYASDVEAGRTDGAALVAALHAAPEFRADLEAARVELASLRATEPVLRGEACEVPDQAAAHTPWTR